MVNLLPSVRRVAAALLILAAALLLAPLTVPAVHADGPTDQEQLARDIARSLQCPICENNSVLDSPSQLAADMRSQIREQLAAGKSRDEIMRYFVARYGEGVLREPPKQGFTLLVWVGPIAALAIAAAVVAGVLRRRMLRPAPVDAEADPEIPLAPEDAARYTALVEQEVARFEEGSP